MTDTARMSSASGVSRFKSRRGIARVWSATRSSIKGLAAAWRLEAAFRQEVLVGVPLMVLGAVLARDRWEALALVLPILAVWVVELLNSAIEALADAISLEVHPMLGRAKELGSAAVMLTIAAGAGVWVLVLLPRWW